MYWIKRTLCVAGFLALVWNVSAQDMSGGDLSYAIPRRSSSSSRSRSSSLDRSSSSNSNNNNNNSNNSNSQQNDRYRRDNNNNQSNNRNSRNGSNSSNSSRSGSPGTVANNRSTSSSRSSYSPKNVGNSKPGGTASASAPVSAGQVKEVTKGLIESIKTQKTDYSEKEMAQQPGVLILGHRKYRPETEERKSASSSGQRKAHDEYAPLARPL